MIGQFIDFSGCGHDKWYCGVGYLGCLLWDMYWDARELCNIAFVMCAE